MTGGLNDTLASSAEVDALARGLQGKELVGLLFSARARARLSGLALVTFGPRIQVTTYHRVVTGVLNENAARP